MTPRLRQCVLLLTLCLLPRYVFAQPQAGTAPPLPSIVPISDIVIAMRRGGTEGCAGRCIAYRVIVRGTGIVEYHDMGGEPRDPDRQRSIPVEEVVSLLEALLQARFLDAPDEIKIARRAIRRDDTVILASLAGAGLQWDLALTLGDWFKLVTLRTGIPADLAAIRDRLDALGGPSAWTTQ